MGPFSFQVLSAITYKMAAGLAGCTSKPDAEVAAQVPFYDLCCLLEKIADTSGTEKKKKILLTFISSWRETHRKLHRDASKTVSGVINFRCATNADCRLADLQTCRLADSQTCRRADSAYWPFPTHLKNNIV